MHNEIRIPKQKRSIKKKDKIIEAGWKLITTRGYYNTNTVEIAKKAGVSIGIIYQYFNDKHDILIEGLNVYGDSIFFPILNIKDKRITKDNFSHVISGIIYKYILNHSVYKKAHEEIMAMVHLDKDVENYFYTKDINLTNNIYDILIKNGFNDIYLKEKIHIMISMVDNLCHEIIYHKHKELDYKIMCKLLIESIDSLIKKK